MSRSSVMRRLAWLNRERRCRSSAISRSRRAKSSDCTNCSPLVLTLAALSVLLLMATGPASAQGGEPGVSIAADAISLEAGDTVTLTADIANAPAGKSPQYDWDICAGDICISSPAHSLKFNWDKAGTWTFQLTVSYDGGETARSNQVSVAWVDAGDGKGEPTATLEPATPTATATLTPEATPTPTPEPAAPRVTGVAVTSDAGTDNTYILGEVIRITLTFSEAVDVTGTPTVNIDMDPAEWGTKPAGYASGTTGLVSTHTVVEPNVSTRGIAVLADTLALNGGSIQSASSQIDADLSHAGLGHDASH